LVSLIDVSLTLTLVRLLPSLLRWLIRLLGICRFWESLLLNWLEMVFELLAGRSSNSVNLGTSAIGGSFDRSFFPGKSLFVGILLLIHLIVPILALVKAPILCDLLSRIV
jgi:hypothetical protein